MPKFAEQYNIHPSFIPVDLSSAANTGDWFGLEGYGKIVFLFISAVGTAGDDPTLTVQEATANDGTGAQNLVVVDKVWVKQAATSLNSTGTYTMATQTAAATYTEATAAEQVAMWILEIDAEQMTDGYDFINCSCSDVGTNAQLGAMFAILCDPRYPQGTLTSPLS